MQGDRRAPHGARGLKCEAAAENAGGRSSCPAWGTWIEIFSFCPGRCWSQSCPAWGTWIEILRDFQSGPPYCRAPHGARGLKLLSCYGRVIYGRSCPAWGTWIEISCRWFDLHTGTSCPAWGTWIEILFSTTTLSVLLSCPAWGTWIEILHGASPYRWCVVVPRMGHVD